LKASEEETNLQSFHAEGAGVKILQSVHGCFVVDQVAAPLETLLAESTLMVPL
jgi:hypothetical protein